MADTGGGGEPDATGGRSMGVTNRIGRVVVGLGARLGNVAAQTSEFKDLTTAINSVTESLKNLSEKSSGYATTIANNLNKVSNAAGGGSSNQVAGSGYAATARNQASAAQGNTGTGNTPTPPANTPPASSGGGGVSGAAWSAASWLGGTPDNSLLPNLAMTPLRFVRDRIQTNRNVVLTASTMLNMTGLRGGVGQDDMLKTLGSQIGNVKGSPADILNLFANSGALGASYGFNGGPQGVRAGGYFQGIQQMQALNPGASVQSMVGALGGQASNTASQQQSIMMTGGAYSMIGAGGRQKSLSEWADSILKWLQDLRPGEKRGQAFTYIELMSQYYPGSNFDAWFQSNGISQEMREYWWTYALGKANRSVASDASGNLFQVANPAAIGPPDTRTQKNNLAALKLNTTNVMTQGEFSLGSKMSGAYGNKEQANRMFGEMMSKFLASALPGALSDGVLGFMQYLPDIIEDLLFGLIERAPGNAQTAIGVGGILDALLGDVGDTGDIGDPMSGAYGSQGGTSTSGMNLDMRRKLGAMQKANPKIKITSGLRDTGLQQRLKKKGHKNVSGKPSAHTRGMAADLGPRSEYGWIAANASKFGLKSGISQGEPWHVGMGDIGDVGDIGDFMEDLQNILKGLTGGGSNLGAEGMFGIMSSIMGLLGKGLTSDGKEGPSFQPDLYDRLLLKDNEGLPIKRTTTVSAGAGGVPSGGGGGSATSPTGSGTVGVGKNYLTGEQVAQLAYNQGFRGNNLVNAVAIAKRESIGFNANAYNGNAGTGDKSYGLWQINMIDTLGPSRRASLNITSNEELFDPATNARAMKMLYDSRPDKPFYHWGPYKGKEATYSTNVDEARTYVQNAGLGDLAEYQVGQTGAVRQGNVVFVNTFNLQGGASGGTNAGIDIRRTVTQMADHLENEMKTRLSRVS